MCPFFQHFKVSQMILMIFLLFSSFLCCAPTTWSSLPGGGVRAGGSGFFLHGRLLLIIELQELRVCCIVRGRGQTLIPPTDHTGVITALLCPVSRLLTLNVAASLGPKCAFISPKDVEIPFATARRHCSRRTKWIWLSNTASRCALCRKQYQRGGGRLVARLSNRQTLQSVLLVMKSPLL